MTPHRKRSNSPVDTSLDAGKGCCETSDECETETEFHDNGVVGDAALVVVVMGGRDGQEGAIDGWPPHSAAQSPRPDRPQCVRGAPEACMSERAGHPSRGGNERAAPDNKSHTIHKSERKGGDDASLSGEREDDGDDDDERIMCERRLFRA